jgi:hypothetical protein
MSWISDLFGGNEAQARADSLDNQLKASEADYAPGGRVYNSIAATQGIDAANKAYATVQGHVAAGTAADAHIGAQIDQAFTDQLNTEISDVGGAVSTAVKVPFKLAWSAIPWQVWVLGAVLLFFYMGGAKLLKGSLVK